MSDPAAAAAQPGRGTCLVVDDSRTVRRAARRMLQAHDFAVREAADGREALEACRAGLPAAVLLDWNMPVLDGLGFLRAARAEFGPDRPWWWCARRRRASTASWRRWRPARRSTS
jgi:two-component system, chemotaxis family, chemotaxis protein CheY